MHQWRISNIPHALPCMHVCSIQCLNVDLRVACSTPRNHLKSIYAPADHVFTDRPILRPLPRSYSCKNLFSPCTTQYSVTQATYNMKKSNHLMWSSLGYLTVCHISLHLQRLRGLARCVLTASVISLMWTQGHR